MTRPSIDEMVAGIRRGDRVMLSRAITLVESTRPADYPAAEELVARGLEHAGTSIRIGVTGAPGVGKSTFIEALGVQIIERGRRVAVLAVDPSSTVSGGSILGDKTRMPQLASSPAAFVRPSPSGGTAGGVTRRTREVIVLCEAAGYDTIIVETVGAGQAEIAVHSMVDFFLLLALAGAGDELQGIKRGIVEMADAIVITKADEENERAAQRARAQFISALKHFPASDSGWAPRVHVCSAVAGKGLDTVWETITEFEALARSSNRFEATRREQRRYWLRETLHGRLIEALHADPAVEDMLARYEQMVVDQLIGASAAADAVIDTFKRGPAADNQGLAAGDQ